LCSSKKDLKSFFLDDKGLLGSQSTPEEVVVQASNSKQNPDENGGTDIEGKIWKDYNTNCFK